MSKTHLVRRSSELAQAWSSVVVGRAANSNIKVLRMDGAAYPSETHAFSEGLLVVQGRMNLEIGGEIVPVQEGELFIVPAGVAHAVASGSPQ